MTYAHGCFFHLIVPATGRRTLEIGSGERRVARDLAARAHRIAAIDTAHTLLRFARHDDLAGVYLRADGGALPFADRSFDVVVAHNSLQVVADMATTVCEAGRVLTRGGSLCACVAHRVTDLGRFTGDDADPTFTMRRRYFETALVEDTVQVDGLTLTCRGWTYTLEHYALALEQAGLHIDAIRECERSLVD